MRITNDYGSYGKVAQLGSITCDLLCEGIEDLKQRWWNNNFKKLASSHSLRR